MQCFYFVFATRTTCKARLSQTLIQLRAFSGSILYFSFLEKRKVLKEIQGRRERSARATGPCLPRCSGVLFYKPVA